MGLQPDKLARNTPYRRTLLSSGAPTQHITVGALLQKRQKMEAEKLLKKEEKQPRRWSARKRENKVAEVAHK